MKTKELKIYVRLYQEIFDIIIDIMKKREDLQFKITNKIKNLEIGELKDNLFHYSYDSKTLKSLFKNNISKDNISYITAHSSFKGEIYENIIYELLIDYALNNDGVNIQDHTEKIINFSYNLSLKKFSVSKSLLYEYLIRLSISGLFTIP